MLPTTPAPDNARRLAWVDNLRVVAIAGVIVVHTATAYVTDFADWYYDDELRSTVVGFVVFAIPALLGGIFGLGPLFWLAGWFSVPSLRRRGPGGFALSRAVRLGVPLAVFVLVVNPLADLVGGLRQEDRSFVSYLGETEFSVMWFVVVLLICSLGYAALRAVAPAPADARAPRLATYVGAAMLIAVLGVAIWPHSSLLDGHLMSLRPGAWAQGTVLFALGTRAAETCRTATADATPGLDRAAERRAGWPTLAGMVGVIALVGAMAGSGELTDALHEMSGPAVAFALVYGEVSVSFSLWCLAWFRRRWGGHRAWMRVAGRASYATYLLHPLVLTGVMVCLAWVPGGAEVKFLLVVALGIPACFAVGAGATNLPGLRRLL